MSQTEDWHKDDLRAHNPEVTTVLEVWDYQRDSHDHKTNLTGFDVRGFQLEENGDGHYELYFVKHFNKGKMASNAGRLRMTLSTLKELNSIIKQAIQ